MGASAIEVRAGYTSAVCPIPAMVFQIAITSVGDNWQSVATWGPTAAAAFSCTEALGCKAGWVSSVLPSPLAAGGLHAGLGGITGVWPENHDLFTQQGILAWHQSFKILL